MALVKRGWCEPLTSTLEAKLGKQIHTENLAHSYRIKVVGHHRGERGENPSTAGTCDSDIVSAAAGERHKSMFEIRWKDSIRRPQNTYSTFVKTREGPGIFWAPLPDFERLVARKENPS